MKRTTYLLSFLLAGVTLGLSCTKAKNEIEIEDKNLTSCGNLIKCEQIFTEHGDLEEANNNFKEGPYRLFSNIEETLGYISILYIKAPMQGNSFLLSGKDIASGRVRLARSCASCLMAPYQPVDGGYVKGINLTPGKRADQTKWLVEAQVVLKAEGNPAANDTLYFKRYFYPNFIFD